METEPLICCNCGFRATHNYCARCGQETHLHKDTFWGLAAHFIGHYFHYDSKFWKTLKSLWLAPGKLSREYWEGKRARAISPVSLYIFISAVFFIVSFSFGTDGADTHNISPEDIRLIQESREKEVTENGQHQASAVYAFRKSLRDKALRIERQSHSAVEEKINEQFNHNIPKLFFFMIPLMAWMLNLMFLKRKDAHFAHHSIFALHIHSFFFSLFLLPAVNPFEAVNSPLIAALAAVFAFYFVIAIHNAYKISYRRAAVISIAVMMAYGIVFLAGFLLLAFYLLRDV